MDFTQHKYYNKNVTIYKLVCPNTQDIKYVGKTICTLEERLSNHNGHSPKLYNWFGELTKQGKKPLIFEIEKILIDSIESLDKSDKREKYWIAFYKSNGCDLLNMTHCNKREKLNSGQSYGKKDIPKSLFNKFLKSANNHLNKQEHYTAIGMSHMTYRDVIKGGVCRSDVLDKIKMYLNKMSK